jgi:hypothetical protein
MGLVAEQDRRGAGQIGLVDRPAAPRRGRHDAKTLVAEGPHRYIQGDLTGHRHVKQRTGAGPNRLLVVRIDRRG